MNPQFKAYLPAKIENRITWAIIALYAAIALGYALGGPLFAASDEMDHFARVYEMARAGGITSSRSVSYEFYQAPLYYLMAAPVVRAFSQDLLPTFQPVSYFSFSSRDLFPFLNPVVRAARLVKLLSAGLGVITLLECRVLFQKLWPEHPQRRLLGLGVVAFWPQFQFMSGAVTNDILIFCTTTLCLALLMHIARHGYSLRSSVFLGVASGAALLAKANGIVLLFPIMMSGLLSAKKERKYAAIVLAVAVAISGWWYIGNWLRTGDPTNQKPMYETMPEVLTSPEERTIPYFLDAVKNVYDTLWANLGIFTGFIGDGVYRYFDVLTLVGGAGMLWQGIRLLSRWRSLPQAIPRQLLIATFYLCALVGAVSTYATMNRAGHMGRFMLPGIGLLAAGVAVGMVSLMPRRMETRLTLSLICLQAVVSLITMSWLLFPPLQPLPATPAMKATLAYTYDTALELVGAGASRVEVSPGELVLVTLDWHALRTDNRNLMIYLLTPKTDRSITRLVFATSYLRSNEWQAGQSWNETYYFQIPSNLAPGQYPLQVFVIDANSHNILPIVDSGESPVTSPDIGYLIVLPR